MDSKIVTRELRTVMRPMLEGAGFTTFRGRNAWRSLEDQTWVVNFQSFNSHVADGVGCTTYSFSLRLGIHLAEDLPLAGSADAARPREEVCSFRFTGLKRLSQPYFHPWGQTEATDRGDVWFVREDGGNLSEVIGDARDVIASAGLQQLEAYRDPLYAYCALFDYARSWPPPGVDDAIEVIPSGGYDSPRWRRVAGILAHRLGRDPAVDRGVGLAESLLLRVLGR